MVFTVWTLTITWGYLRRDYSQRRDRCRKESEEGFVRRSKKKRSRDQQDSIQKSVLNQHKLTGMS